MKTLLLPLAVALACHAHAQVAPICDSPANGSAWRLVGPNSLPTPGTKATSAMTGTGAELRLQFLDTDQPRPQILYACTPTGGLFCTLDAWAETPVWENLTDSTRLPVLGVQGFDLLPGQPETIFIGAGIRYPLDIQRLYGIGLLRSVDGGRRWQTTGLAFEPPGGNRREVCHDVLLVEKNPLTVHALCGQDYYRSDDGGQVFTKKMELQHPCPAGWGKSFRDISAKPGNPQLLYLTSDGNFFYRSDDGGDTWAETDVRPLGLKDETDRMDVATSPINPDLVYLVCHTKAGATILRSLDTGLSWEMVFEKSLRTSYERNAVAVSPTDVNVLYLGGLYIDRVTIGPGGGTSTTISSGLHLDHRDLLAISDGQGGDLLFSANDGGLYRGVFRDKKWQWQDISGTGLNNTQFYGIAVAEDFSVVMGGTQDNGMLVGDREGRFFKPNIGGDAVDAAIDRYDPMLAYGTTWALQPPTVHRSTDGGQTFERALTKGFPDKADTYYFPLETHEDGHLYAGKKQVFKLRPDSEEWQQIGILDLPTEHPFKVTAMCVAPSDPDYIYAYGDRVYRTVNALSDSVVWQDVGSAMGRAALPAEGGGVISSVEVHASDPRQVWVGFRDYGVKPKVIYSADAGLTWQDVSRGLPPWPVNALAFQAGTAGALYAGTDVGVFYNPTASDPASEWLCFNGGLPVCLVTDLEMNYCPGSIVAGTYGRGIWESAFAGLSVFPAVEVDGDATWGRRIFRGDLVVRSGATLTLTDEVRMAAGAKILVEKNAKLVLDSAHISALCGGAWEGVVLETALNFFQRFFGAENGVLELKNGGGF